MTKRKNVIHINKFTTDKGEAANGYIPLKLDLASYQALVFPLSRRVQGQASELGYPQHLVVVQLVAKKKGSC